METVCKKNTVLCNHTSRSPDFVRGSEPSKYHDVQTPDWIMWSVLTNKTIVVYQYYIERCRILSAVKNFTEYYSQLLKCYLRFLSAALCSSNILRKINVFAFESRLSAVTQIICPIKLLIRVCLVMLYSHSLFFFSLFTFFYFFVKAPTRNF